MLLHTDGLDDATRQKADCLFPAALKRDLTLELPPTNPEVVRETLATNAKTSFKA